MLTTTSLLNLKPDEEEVSLCWPDCLLWQWANDKISQKRKTVIYVIISSFKMIKFLYFQLVILSASCLILYTMEEWLVLPVTCVYLSTCRSSQICI